MTTLPITWAGSSWTAGSYYRATVQTWLAQYLDYLRYWFTFANASISGHNVWSNLVRLTRDALANSPSVFILDHANGFPANGVMEAIIRRVWSYNPNIRIILLECPTWNGVDYHDNANVVNPSNQENMAAVNAIAAAYNIPIVRVWEWCKTVVPGTYDLDALFTDGVHPAGDAVSAYIQGQLETLLAAGLSRTPADLPARLYDSEDYEYEATIIDGTDYTAKTGTWTEADGVISSTTAGATVTYTATCASYGCYNTGDINIAEASIDGGAFASAAVYQNGTIISAGRGSHTITIRIPAGGTCQIDQFWTV